MGVVSRTTRSVTPVWLEDGSATPKGQTLTFFFIIYLFIYFWALRGGLGHRGEFRRPIWGWFGPWG